MTDIEDYAAGRAMREEQRMAKADSTWLAVTVLLTSCALGAGLVLGYLIGASA